MNRLNEIIVIRPVIKDDEVTSICYDEAQEVVDYAQSKGWKVIDIAKDDAVREKVEQTLKEHPNVLVCHYNHGAEDAWWGSDSRKCVNINNVEVLANRECYAQNCSSAKKLGVEAWKLKATYWGYTDVYVFTIDEKEYFKKFNNYGIKLRIDGEEWSEALKKTKKLAEELVKELLDKGKAFAAACLHRNAEILVLYDEEHPPTSDCLIRRISIKLFGPRIGWKLTRMFPLSLALFFLSMGVMLHDFCHECWLYGGYSEILSLHGFYIGFILAIVSFLLAYYQIFVTLKK